MKHITLFTILTISLFSLNSEARTLQSLAQLSNALLVVADHAATKTSAKSCNLTSQQVSEKSQALQVLIDEKSAQLNQGDFAVLEKRADTCDKDCTCDIYAYALEKREHPIQAISDKAANTHMTDRQKCMNQIKNICAQIRLLK